MSDVEAATQGVTGTATQGSNTTGNAGSGAPTDAPAEELYSLQRVKAIAAKEKRVGEQLGRKALLDTYGIESEEDLAKLLEVSRAAQPAKKSDADRQLEKKQAEWEKAIAERDAKLAAVQAERDSGLLRETAKGVLANAGLVEGAADLVLAALGLGVTPEHRLVVKDGVVTVVDRDGDPTGKTVDQYLTEYVKTRTYLQSSPVQAASGTRKTQAPDGPKGPQRKRSFQEELDEIVRVGMSSHNANGGR